jgi:hypothetical protein
MTEGIKHARHKILMAEVKNSELYYAWDMETRL